MCHRQQTIICHLYCPSYMFRPLQNHSSGRLYISEYIYSKILRRCSCFSTEFTVSIFLRTVLPDNGFVEAETYRRDIVNDKGLFIVDYTNCWIKYCTFILLHGIWSTLNFHLDNCSETQAYVVVVFSKEEYGKIFVFF